jgi:hypothetical protein
MLLMKSTPPRKWLPSQEVIQSAGITANKAEIISSNHPLPRVDMSKKKKKKSCLPTCLNSSNDGPN